MMISLDEFHNTNNLNEEYDLVSNSNSKDELTLITANNYTERAPSVVCDDVGSDTNLDYYPVREFQKEKESIEIIDIPERIQSYEDKSKISKCENSTDKFKNSYKNIHPTNDVDVYDLEDRHYDYDDSSKYCDELMQTVRHIPLPSVTLTKHETPRVEDRYLSQSPLFNTKYQNIIDNFPPTTDIGLQITQLARRIESLGNISRICQDDIENRPLVCLTDKCHNVLDSGQIVVHHHEEPQTNDFSLKAARKLDEIERLQKKQEAMQSRLVDLAKKLNDSTRDLSRLPNAAPAVPNEQVNSDDYFHGKVLKTPKKSTKKPGHKTRKANKSVSKSPPSSTFLKNILNDNNETRTNELPLLSSSYCLHNDLSTGSPETGISESTSKYLNNELANIRAEFRNQVEEIRKLLSERYQHSAEFVRTNQSTQHVHEPLSDQIMKSVQKLSRDASPTLRNITNINNNNEETPLDKYLVKSNKTTELPSLHSDVNPSLRPGILPSVARAIKNKQRMLSDPVEAEKFLIELSNRRANLENNLSCLERTKEGEFLFTVLEKLQGDERDVDIARIQAMVDDAITFVTPAINQEVKAEFQNWIERRRHQQEQQLLADEEDRQVIAKKKVTKPSKFPQYSNYNALPSTSAISGKPWVCKKYLDVRSKVDSGVRKLPEKSVSRGTRSPSPSKHVTMPPPDAHSTWANRRRYRTPYLHFVNDVKLAKKSIAPLGEGIQKAPVSKKWNGKYVTKTSMIPVKKSINDDLMLMSVKQYSLNYKEEEDDLTPKQKRNLVTIATSPQAISDPSSTHPQEIEIPSSPTFSERGTGFQIRSKTSSRPREDRVGPYTPMDPTETTRIDSHPVHVFVNKTDRRRPSPTNVGPDINGLRQLIERALLDQIQIPTPATSLDHSGTLTLGDGIATPLPTEGADSYSTQFSPEHSVKDQYDRTVTPYDDIKTPEASQLISDYSFKPSRVSTPSNSAVSSQKISERKPNKISMVSAAMQTICDNAAQTAETKEVQTMPSNSATQTPKSPRQQRSTESYTASSDFNGSQSDTQAHSFSDGMWLYDRSEGEMAPIQIDTVDRWRMGSCTDHPLWYNGTDDIMNINRHSSLSFGEFTKPTLPGLIPTRDPVLQLKTLPFKPFCETPVFNGQGDDLVYMGHHQEPLSPHFRSLGVSRDSKSKFTTPRNYQASPTNFNESEGEIDFNDDDADSFDDGNDTRRRDDQNNNSSGEYSHQSPYLMNIRQSNDSGGVTGFSGPPIRDSQSDRMHVDVNKYLRASKQSHSDTSDAGGLLSTAQIVANAFRGGDSVDLEGSSDFGMDKYYDNQHPAKPTVKIPTLGTVEQSNPSVSDDNLEIIDISEGNKFMRNRIGHN